MHEESGPSWGMRGLRKWLSTAPETRDELLKLVQDSRRFLEPDTVAMLEGVLDLPATKIREVMTPRTAMISLQEDDQLLDILHTLIESAHSRFPVFSSDQPDNVVGILLAKDLLPYSYYPLQEALKISLESRLENLLPEKNTLRNLTFGSNPS